ncbi:hypothetical protein E4L40_21740 [Pseudomonas putida]|nr:hypothetical protein E4L40_21740 [Pseudomonas putida]
MRPAVNGGLCFLLSRPLRGHARSQRYSAGPEGCVNPVGAGLPAKGPVQATNYFSPMSNP